MESIIERSYQGFENLRAEKDTRAIEGYAVVYNKRSTKVIDWDRWEVVEEVIEPGAITDELLRSCDIVACLEHNPDRMLARCKNGEGTLKLELDDVGLKFRFSCPNTADGDFASEMVARGDITGCSFAYSTDAKVNVHYVKETTEDGKEQLVRHVDKIDALYDVSIVRKPAYGDTEVEVKRSLDADREKILADLGESEEVNKKHEQRSEECISDHQYLSELYK